MRFFHPHFLRGKKIKYLQDKGLFLLIKVVGGVCVGFGCVTVIVLSVDDGSASAVERAAFLLTIVLMYR